MSPRRRSGFGVLAAAALGCALAGGATAPCRAAEPPTEPPAPYAQQLWRDIMSPYCRGLTLIDCPSSEAAELREWIAAQERAGRPRRDVEAELLLRFGEKIRQAPPPRGFGLLAYLIPGALLALGAVAVCALLGPLVGRRRLSRPDPSRHPDPRGGGTDPELERRIDEELSASR